MRLPLCVRVCELKGLRHRNCSLLEICKVSTYNYYHVTTARISGCLVSTVLFHSGILGSCCVAPWFLLQLRLLTVAAAGLWCAGKIAGSFGGKNGMVNISYDFKTSNLIKLVHGSGVSAVLFQS